MQQQYNSRTERLQEQLFGKRYVGANLGNTRFRHGEAEKILKWLEKPRNFLVMVGPPGTGKTYFCSAILEHVSKTFMQIRGYDERALLKRLRDVIADRSNGDYLDALRELTDDDFLIVDDIGSAGHTVWREEILMHLVDQRYSNCEPTVFTSNLSRKEFNKLYHSRVSSRLFAKDNLVIDMDGALDWREEDQGE